MTVSKKRNEQIAGIILSNPEYDFWTADKCGALWGWMGTMPETKGDIWQFKEVWNLDPDASGATQLGQVIPFRGYGWACHLYAGALIWGRQQTISTVQNSRVICMNDPAIAPPPRRVIRPPEFKKICNCNAIGAPGHYHIDYDSRIIVTDRKLSTEYDISGTDLFWSRQAPHKVHHKVYPETWGWRWVSELGCVGKDVVQNWRHLHCEVKK